MKKFLLISCALAALCACTAMPEITNVIIPQPVSVEPTGAVVELDLRTASPEVTLDGDVLGSPEGYELVIDADGVTVRAGSEAGVFYARQTIAQLAAVYKGRVPAVRIVDAPRFAYRGMHLDVSRHFQDKEFVKKQLDMFASLKLNVFHFHLTDGIGWRLQIDRYPELTDVTAWKPAGWKYGDPTDAFASADTPDAVGGYYTKDDIREILAYAEKLHITVIPEIEMFGHSTEVLHVHPELRCQGPSVQESPRPVGEFCIGNEGTFEFLENVLSEVIDLFPSEYIHIGGDEASMRHWAECPLCQARMKAEGLTDVQELQSYGIARIERFVNGKGRQIIGWEEIAKGGLAPNAALMSWLGVEAGQKATATGHKVVFCPEPYCYFDAYQDEPVTLPDAMGNYVPLHKVYEFDPAEGDFEGKDLIWGVQANLWTERVEEPSHAELMYYPRTFALAEVAWTMPGNKDFGKFRERALLLSDIARRNGYTVFDLRREVGPRPGSEEPVEHLAVGAGVIYNDARHNEPDAPRTDILVDGRCGTWVSRYPGWDRFVGEPADVTVDMGEVKDIRNIETSFASFGARYGGFPVKVVFEISEDGADFRRLASLSSRKKADAVRPDFQTFRWKGKARARFVRVVAEPGEVARGDGNARFGGRPAQSLVCLDEIIVR